MTYAQTLEYLFQQLPMYQRVGKAAYKADLNSTLELMSCLGHPERNFKSIHVAGTNGKGSVSHLIASVFQAAGYKTGLYTSPHLVDFRERIRVDGHMISESFVTRFVQDHKSNFETLNLSFFEWTVGLAFDFFSQEQVDIAIVEVGMGGRLDSTNVITPELSIITNIGNDHSEFLGDTPAQIAQEKAGIIKSGVPVVVGRSQRETEGVFRKLALHHNAPIVFADQQMPDEIPGSDLKGLCQRENKQTAFIALELLSRQAWQISMDHIRDGFQNVCKTTGLRGRWDNIQSNPNIVCDVAHNVEGLTYIIDQLKTTPYHDLHLVLGFVKDKNVAAILELIPRDAFLYLCQPEIPRAMPIDRLSQIASDADLKFQSFSNVSEAVKSARQRAISDDLIFIGGSTFVVADFLRTEAA